MMDREGRGATALLVGERRAAPGAEKGWTGVVRVFLKVRIKSNKVNKVTKVQKVQSTKVDF
jgi:hypothetical protein